MECGPRLNVGEVHLWSASLDVEDERFRFYRSCMDSVEQARFSQFQPERARVRYICARGILKELLGLYTGVDPKTISFDYGPKGKPYLTTDSELSIQFNSTDTKNEALYAFCYNAELGVDIEFTSRVVNHSGLAKKKLTLQEFDYYNSLPEEFQRECFLSLWTRKEAYGKARGVGIRYTLNTTNLIGSKGLNDTTVTDQNGKIWELIQVSPKDDITACVVTEGVSWKIRGFRFSD